MQAGDVNTINAWSSGKGHIDRSMCYCATVVTLFDAADPHMQTSLPGIFMRIFASQQRYENILGGLIDKKVRVDIYE